MHLNGILMACHYMIVFICMSLCFILRATVKAYVLKSIMKARNGFRKLEALCTACVRVVVQCMICGFVCLTVNCFSSCFIMAQGKSKRQRTFLELRLQTVSLVSNL